MSSSSMNILRFSCCLVTRSFLRACLEQRSPKSDKHCMAWVLGMSAHGGSSRETSSRNPSQPGSQEYISQPKC